MSFLDEEGTPSVVEKATILPPKSKFGTISDQQRLFLINSSPMFQKYNTLIDRESAYEILQMQNKEKLEAENKLKEEKLQEIETKKQEKQKLADEKLNAKELKEQEKIRIAHEKAKEKSRKNNPLSKVARTTLNTVTGDVGRKIARGLLGNIKKMF